MADLIDRTAQQVRLPGQGSAHDMTKAETRDGLGRAYWTRCGRLFTAQQGAVLTTADVSCSLCRWAAT
jgi:hypothetical protein